MKTFFTLFALAALYYSVPALAAEGPQGTYAFKHEVAFGGGYSERSCKKDNGRWQNGACYFSAADMITVAPVAAPAEWNVKVETIRTNGRTCEFVGRAKSISRNELVASMDSEEMLPGSNPDDAIYVPAVCEIKLTYLDNNTVRVTNLDQRKCEYVCAYISGLEVPGAKRFK